MSINTFSDKANPTPGSTEKPKRVRKRLVEAVNDPYEIKLEERKFRKLEPEKRFINPEKTMEKRAITSTNRWRISNDEKDFIHPATCLHSTIVDLEIEGEVDTKRNFKIFTHHVEHRYNTLVLDINFRLHFLMKDFIDEEQERIEHDELVSSEEENNWPPLSQEYVEKYVLLENQVLRNERDLLAAPPSSPAKRIRLDSTSGSDQDNAVANDYDDDEDDCLPLESSAVNKDPIHGVDEFHLGDKSITTNATSVTQQDSGIDMTNFSESQMSANVSSLAAGSFLTTVANSTALRKSMLDDSVLRRDTGFESMVDGTRDISAVPAPNSSQLDDSRAEIEAFRQNKSQQNGE